MNKEPDFIAELYYLTPEQGGRRTPFFKTGYRPQVEFPFSSMQTSGQQTFLNKDVVYPGDNVIVEIAIASPQFFEKQLSVGLNFLCKEGSRIIAKGKILEILNFSLLKAS